MPIKRPRIDLEKLGIIQESTVDRRARMENVADSARSNTQSKLDRIAEHNAREDARTKRIREKIIKGGLWLDIEDLMGPMPGMPQRLTEDYPVNNDNMLTEDYEYPTHKARPMPPTHKARPLPENTHKTRRSLQEDIREPVAPVRRQSQWGVKKFLGETRGGDTISVWKVSNSKTGTSLDKMFRIESVADKVAMLLNESGDSNDPRAVSLISAYDKRDRLLKEARQLEKTAEGKPMKSERLRAVRAEINQLDYRLGI